MENVASEHNISSSRKQRSNIDIDFSLISKSVLLSKRKKAQNTIANTMSPSLTSPNSSNGASGSTNSSGCSSNSANLTTASVTASASACGGGGPIPLTKNVGVGANLNISRSNHISSNHAVSLSRSVNNVNNGSKPYDDDGLIIMNHISPSSSTAADNTACNNGGGGGISGHLSSSQQPSPSLMTSSSNVLENLHIHHQHGRSTTAVLQQHQHHSPIPPVPSITTINSQIQQQYLSGSSVSSAPTASACSSAIVTTNSLTSLKNIQRSNATIPPQLQQQQHSNNISIPTNSPSARICSQNLNGTLAVTSVPRDDSELQLFRVLQRANLLNYFDVMIELGGDDVQQLCEAGEEEFLEIMALVGMAQKPLHVRRLQKALQEFMTQPHLFPGPTVTTPTVTPTPPPPSIEPLPSPNQMPIRPIPFHSTGAIGLISPGAGPPNNMTSPHHGCAYNPVSPSPTPAQTFLNSSELKNIQMKIFAMRNSTSSNELSRSNSPASSNPSPSSFPIPSQSPTQLPRNTVSPSLFPTLVAMPSVQIQNSHNRVVSDQQQQQLRPPPEKSALGSQQHLNARSQSNESPGTTTTASTAAAATTTELHLNSRISLSPIPFLQDNEIQQIVVSAVKIVECLPEHMHVPRISKRKGSADYENVIKLAEDDPRKQDEIRKYSPIYGRYDCKRKVQKPLTIHELSVNEAAAQLCSRVPALLTRRDELFLLARQVVREAGLPYSSIISSTCTTTAGSHLISQIQQNMMMRNNSKGSTTMSSEGSPADPYSLQHNNNNNLHAKRIRLAENEDFNRSSKPATITTTADFESSDASSHSQLSSYSGSDHTLERRSPYEFSRYDPMLSSSNNGSPPSSAPGLRGRGCYNVSASAFNSIRRNSLEPDDLSIAKVNQIEDNNSEGINLRSTKNNNSNNNNNMRVKSEPR